jgi:coenzyme F420-dependent glucose-6-phosphate dehydrogenase
VAKEIIGGPDPEPHLAKLDEYAAAGFDHVWVHQVGSDQAGFFHFYEQEVLPKLAERRATNSGKGRKARASTAGR